MNKKDYMSYRTWANIKTRCYNKNCKMYKYYWWKWIVVCDKRQTFDWFFDDMWEKPWLEYSIERIDNDIWYCKDNCKRISMNEQQRNKKSNIYYNWKLVLDICKNEKVYKRILARTYRWESIESACLNLNSRRELYENKSGNQWAVHFWMNPSSFNEMKKKKWWLSITVEYYKSKYNQ